MALVRTADPRDSEIFELLYKQYSPLIKQQAAKFGNQMREDMEDLAQDIFLLLWIRRDKLAEIESFDNYIFIVVRNYLSNRHKKTRVKKKLVALFELYRLCEPPVSNHTLEIFQYRETHNRLHQEIELLPPQMKKVVRLRQNGYKKKEIATLLGINPHTVSCHFQKAKKILKKRLEGI
jgi:RNA polymerase sigma factor (sigma-70 family)